MKYKSLNCLSLSVFLFLLACKKDLKEAPLTEQILAIKTQFAPDKRVALFDVYATQEKGIIFLKGESNLTEAAAALKEKLQRDKISFVDSIQMLPSKELENLTNGVVTISVANLRSKPKHSAELATQATLGTPVKVYKREGEWYLIQTPDNYLSWVDAGGIILCTKERFLEWQSSPKIIYTKTFGQSFSTEDKTQIVSDLVAGCILEILEEDDNFYKIRYPDERIAMVPKAAADDYTSWLNNFKPNSDALVERAKTLVGVPYLWGGTSTKAMDCSGFTKTIYFLNGIILPRDASQQVHTGNLVDEDKNFKNLEKGDLLFFGQPATKTNKEKVVHVGMWIGNDEYIHASGQVRISSVNPNAVNFDEYNLNRYLRSKRILKVQDKNLVRLTQNQIFR